MKTTGWFTLAAIVLYSTGHWIGGTLCIVIALLVSSN